MSRCMWLVTCMYSVFATHHSLANHMHSGLVYTDWQTDAVKTRYLLLTWLLLLRQFPVWHGPDTGTICAPCLAGW